MKLKSDLNRSKPFLVLAQISVLFLCLATLCWIMVLSNKERMENDLKERLDASTQAMAAQLKANQVPFSASSVEPGVFIINQTDGSVVVDRRDEGDTQQKLWEGYKTKIIYEMQKQKRGWIEYPDKNSWDFSQPQRIIRYVSIDELNWILAVEELQPSSMDLLKESVHPSTCMLILLIFILGAAALWLMDLRYFELIKRQISDSLEDNLLSLNGEEKLWNKAPPSQTKPVADPIMEEIFYKTPAPKPLVPVQDNIVQPVQEAPKEIQRELPKTAPARAVDNNDMTVDVQHINSPVLKKMLQQFREK